MKRLIAVLWTQVLAVTDDPPFKRDSLRLLLSRVLTRAIWNWINNYPMEFVSLCQVGRSMA